MSETPYRQINLYHPSLRPRRRSLVLRLARLLLPLVLVLALLGLAVYGRQQRLLRQQLAAEQDVQQQLQEQLARLGLQLQQRQPDPVLLRSLAGLRQQLHDRQPLLDLLVRFRQRHPPVAPVLEALARQPLSQLWLTRLQLREGGQLLELEGVAATATAVTEMVSLLTRQPELAGRHFNHLQLQRQDDGRYRFVLASQAGEEAP